MVTHDGDEALLLGDRIVMMTDGPEAQVGDILEVDFPRPRERKAVLEHPEYYKLREYLIDFLEVRAHKKTPIAGDQNTPEPTSYTPGSSGELASSHRQLAHSKPD